MKYTYSQLASDSVLELIKNYYNISDPMTCKFYVPGLHDNYLIECKKNKYIFRIYRNDWRTNEEIQFEIALLTYCKQKMLNISAPVQCKNKDSNIVIECLEGNRLGVLFDYADGRSIVNSISIDEFRLLGASVANFHANTRSFKTKYTRPTFDVSFLVDHSLSLIEPFLNIDQRDYFLKVRSKIFDSISQLSIENSDYGICIGDINISNFHLNAVKKITHFDFDQCGYGYRVFDLGKFVSSLPNDETKKDKVSSFLEGYESIRSITDMERNVIPYFELASIIWVMSIYVSNANRIGYKYLENEFWSKRINLIEKLEKNLV